jgi:hypothetical protein
LFVCRLKNLLPALNELDTLGDDICLAAFSGEKGASIEASMTSWTTRDVAESGFDDGPALFLGIVPVALRVAFG